MGFCFIFDLMRAAYFLAACAKVTVLALTAVYYFVARLTDRGSVFLTPQ